MPTFIVTTREVWLQAIEVKADNAVEATHKIAFTGYDAGTLVDGFPEYSHVLDPTTWTVEKAGDK